MKKRPATLDVIRAVSAVGEQNITALRSAKGASEPNVIQLRQAETGTGPGTIFGYSSVSNQWTEINNYMEGNFLERFVEGAWRKTIKERGDRVRVMFDHGMDFYIGDKPLGKMSQLSEDRVGLYHETPLDDTSYNRDLAASIASGALDGQSVRFRVVSEEWVEPDAPSDYNPKAIPERSITQAALFEHGPVTWPAYEATSVGIRSRAAAAIWYATPPADRAALLESWGEDPSGAGSATLADVIEGSPARGRSAKAIGLHNLFDMRAVDLTRRQAV